jgi:hypothetical protein
MVRGEFRERRPESPSEFLPLQVAGGVVPVALLKPADPGPVFVPPPSRSASGEMEAPVDDRPDHPGPEIRGHLPADPQAQEGLLDGIPGRVLVAEDSPRDGDEMTDQRAGCPREIMVRCYVSGPDVGEPFRFGSGPGGPPSTACVRGLAGVGGIGRDWRERSAWDTRGFARGGAPARPRSEQITKEQAHAVLPYFGRPQGPASLTRRTGFVTLAEARCCGRAGKTHVDDADVAIPGELARRGSRECAPSRDGTRPVRQADGTGRRGDCSCRRAPGRRRLGHAYGAGRGSARAGWEMGRERANARASRRGQFVDELDGGDGGRLDGQLPLGQEMADRAGVGRGMASRLGVEGVSPLRG